MKHLLIFSFALCTMTFNAQSITDEQAISNLIDIMQQGWNSGNGATFASAFAEDHDFIVWNGYYMKHNTISDNARGHQQIFDTFYKDTQLFYTIDKIKFIRKDLALIHVFGAVAPKGNTRPKDPQVLFSAIAEKKDSEWKLISFHNLDLEVFQNEQLMKGAPAAPSVMYANWYTAAPK